MKNNILRKTLLFIGMILAFLYVNAQDKYSTGGVPVENGRVIFTHQIDLPRVSKEVIYEQALAWVNSRYTENTDAKGEILATNPEAGEIIAYGEEYLTFADKALVLDRSKITYNIFIFCAEGSCKIQMTSIRYDYSNQKYQAEKWITDEYALDRKGRLLHGSKKFRIHTIDLAENLFLSFERKLKYETKKIMPAVTPELTLPVRQDSPDLTGEQGIGDMQGYRKISADKIPGNIIKMLSEQWMLITAGNENRYNMMTASWGGLGHLYNKPVAFCFINPARYTYQLMEKSDHYTLTFYTEAYRDVLNYCGNHSGRDKDKVKESGLTPVTTFSGAKAFSEAWMIIECRKLVVLPFTPEALNDPELKGQWSGKELHKMYIGEILNVWIK